MSFEDFARHFTQLDLVHVGPDDWMLEPALHSKQPWRAVLARRRWRGGYNAGGGPSYTGKLIYIKKHTEATFQGFFILFFPTFRQLNKFLLKTQCDESTSSK